MAVVGVAGRAILIYQLDVQPQEFKRMESPLKYQVIISYPTTCIQSKIVKVLKFVVTLKYF